MGKAGASFIMMTTYRVSQAEKDGKLERKF